MHRREREREREKSRFRKRDARTTERRERNDLTSALLLAARRRVYATDCEPGRVEIEWIELRIGAGKAKIS